MTLEEISIAICSILENITGKKISVHQSLLKSGIITSITFIELLVALEDRFSISIEFDEIDRETLDTVASLALFVSKEMDSE